MKGYAAASRELMDSSRRTAIYVIGTCCFNKMHSQSSETTRRAVAIVPLPSLSILSPHQDLQPALLLRAPIEHLSAAPWLRYGCAISWRFMFSPAPACCHCCGFPTLPACTVI